MDFVWGKEEEQAWQLLKDDLVRASILAYAGPQRILSLTQMPVGMALAQYYQRFRMAERKS